MNILFVSHENNLGGATRSLLGLIDCLREMTDFRIFVFVPKFNEDTPQGKLTDALDARNIPYLFDTAYWWMYPAENKEHPGQSLKDHMKMSVSRRTAGKLAAYAEANHIDLIHSNSSVTMVGALAAKKAGCRHVWHIREFGEEDHGYTFTENKEKSLKFMAETTDRFICISKAIYDKYAKLLPAEKCVMIHNGVGPVPEERSVRKEAENLLISGRIKESKGQMEALQALNILVKEGYNDLKLHFAGVGEEEYMKRLEEYIQKEDLSEHTVFHGFVSDMVSLREGMDIELVCSRMEAFGRVTVEGMLSSHPVVGADTGGTKDLILDGKTGLLYRQSDPASLAAQIRRLLDSFELRRDIAHEAYVYAKENCTAGANARKVLSVYNEMVKG